MRVGVRLIVVFLILFAAIGLNPSENMIARLGFEPGLLKAALVAFVLAALVFHERTALIVLVTALTLAANLPPDAAERLHVSPDLSLAGLIALLFMSLMRGHLE
ncbi:MAG TPA: hypothetical protein VKA64_01320 [Gammaproteobacteria bacterium]|nr:hypothetical protein [Gammaproteobacteria bacterium]